MIMGTRDRHTGGIVFSVENGTRVHIGREESCQKDRLTFHVERRTI